MQLRQLLNRKGPWAEAGVHERCCASADRTIKSVRRLTTLDGVTFRFHGWMLDHVETLVSGDAHRLPK
jgi:uncharacterized Zn-binding protein involved in type VI secretion